VKKHNRFLNLFLAIGVNHRKPVRLGLEFSTIAHHGSDYLARLILYVAGTLRLHRFLRGDDDRAPHDHPWWFITFPFTSYVEKYWWPKMRWNPAIEKFEVAHWLYAERVVKAWRFHFRPAKFRHFVIGRADGKNKPFWTFVITGFATNAWGFWPTPTTFVPWKEWK
jgi:hypothetical protein